MTKQIDILLDLLASAEVAADAFNQYAYGSEHNDTRRENLKLYLNELTAVQSRILLVGEAPGYQGCRRSGIPFTSDFIMLNPPEGIVVLGTGKGYRMAGEFDKMRKEPSATIVWNTMAEEGLLPMIWSAYPFHPHKKDKPLSNRAPRVSELKAGEVFLNAVLALLPFRQVVAIGNNADKSLTRLGVPHVKVRHPSQGGKADFVAGIKAVAEEFRQD